MIDLRAEAAYRQCQIRLPGCRTEPTVLCHYRIIGLSGMSLKNIDLLGAWGCSSCHAKVDTAERSVPQTQHDFANGVMRTISILVKEGKVKW